MLAQDRVGPGSVDDEDVLEELDRSRHRPQAGRRHVGSGRFAVAHDVYLRRRRRDAFLEDALSDERVDERALAGIEFPDDDEEEELVELDEGGPERGRVVWRRGDSRQLGSEIGEQVARGL